MLPGTIDPADPEASLTTTPPNRRHRGSVVAFDSEVGLGEIQTSDGQVTRFHAAMIADGTRSIPTGAAVTYSRIARFGVFEAAEIELA